MVGTKEFPLFDGCVAYVPERLDYRRIARGDKLIVIHFDSVNYHTNAVEYFSPQNAEVLKELFVRILNCWNKKEKGYKYQATAILYEILGECHTQNFVLPKKNPKIEKSIAYITEHYRDKDISMAEIANRSFVSEVYFRKLFKKEFGISPSKYAYNYPQIPTEERD